MTFMGINTFSHLLIFLLFQISIMLLTAKHLQVYIPYSLLKHQLKHKVGQLSNLYWKPWSLHFEFLPISLQLPHIHTKDGLSFLHVYSIFYFFHQIMTSFANDSQYSFDHGIIYSWNLTSNVFIIWCHILIWATEGSFGVERRSRYKWA